MAIGHLCMGCKHTCLMVGQIQMHSFHNQACVTACYMLTAHYRKVPEQIMPISTLACITNTPRASLHVRIGKQTLHI